MSREPWPFTIRLWFAPVARGDDPGWRDRVVQVFDTAGDSGSARIGFIGLGELGARMAFRLVDAPGRLTVYDVDVAAAAPLVMRGATMASTVPHLSELCDVVCVRVSTEESARSVVSELCSAAHPGTTIAVHTPLRPESAVELVKEGESAGVHVLDAAVIGGPAGAEQGQLVILVGGSEAGFAAARPAFARMGDLVVHLGPAGAGTHAKLARNLLHYVSFAAAGEAVRLAEAVGVDPVVLGQVVRHSDAVMGGPGAIMWRDTAEPMEHDDPWRAVFEKVCAVGQLELMHAVELAESLGVKTPLAELARRELGPALGLGGGGC